MQGQGSSTRSPGPAVLDKIIGGGISCGLVLGIEKKDCNQGEKEKKGDEGVKIFFNPPPDKGGEGGFNSYLNNPLNPPYQGEGIN
jgi:hypothetical protein